MPITQILPTKIYGCKTIGVERDNSSVCLANKIINKFQLANKAQVIESNARDCSFDDNDHIIMLAECAPKKPIFDHIYYSTKANITYRSPYRLYGLLFPSVKKQDIELCTVKEVRLDNDGFFEIVILQSK